MVKIYTLTNPLNGLVFYVGATSHPLKKRLSNHISQHKTTSPTKGNKDAIMRQIYANGCSPIIESLDEVPLVDAEFWESFYICLIQSFGFDLNQRKSTYSKLDAVKTEIRRSIKNNKS